MPDTTVPANAGISGKRRRRWWIRMLRFAGYAVLVVLVLIIILYFALRWFYSLDKLKQMAAEAVAENMHLKLEVGDAYLDLLHGFVFKDLRLVPFNDSTEMRGDFVLRHVLLRRAEMHYRLRPLLHRKLVVQDILLDSPDVEMFVDMMTPSTFDITTLLRMNLPITFEVRRLQLERARIKFVMGYGPSTQDVYLGSLSCFFDDVHLPRGGLALNDSAVQMTVRLTADNSPVRFSDSNPGGGSLFQAGCRLNLNSAFQVHGYERLVVDLRAAVDQIGVMNKTPQESSRFEWPEPWSLRLALRGNGKTSSLEFDSLRFGMGHATWLQARGRIDSLTTAGRLSMEVGPGRIPLRQLLAIADSVLPASSRGFVRLKNDEAFLSLAGTSVHGSLRNELGFDAHLHLGGVDLTMAGDSLQLVGMDGFLQARGNLRAQTLQAVNLTVQAGYDTLFRRLPDHSVLFTGRGQFTGQVSLNADLVPDTLDASMLISNILGAQLKAQAHLGSTRSLSDLSGKVVLHLTDVDLGRLPGSPVQGDAAASVNWTLKTLGDVRALFSVSTGELVLRGEDDSITLEPIQLQLRFAGGTNPSFDRIAIDTLGVRFNELLALDARADIALAGEPRIKFFLRDLQANHQAIFEYIPESLRERFAGLQFFGSTHLTAEGQVQGSGPQLAYEGRGHLFTRDASYYSPAQFIALMGIRASADFVFDSRRGVETSVDLGLDSLRYDRLSEMVFSHNRFSFNASTDFANLRIADGRLELPDFRTTGSFAVNVSRLTGAPAVEAELDFKQDIRDTLRLPLDLRMFGQNRLHLSVMSDSGLATLKTELLTDGLTLLLPGQMAVHNIQTRLEVQQRYDLVKGMLLESPAYQISTPSPALMDYMVYRDYYRTEGIPLSHIAVDRIDFGGYRVERVNLDLLYQDGRLEVPEFFAALYGGTVGGRLALDLAQGDLSRASFSLNAHFTNINSDLILPKRKGHAAQGMINGNADLRGTGLDPAGEFNPEGQIYLTEIGPRVADNLLRSLDPQGTDSGIRTTRLLINRGFKPKLMTFILRHGYLYPTIVFNQPWYMPIRLNGGKVELARIPLKFFLISTAPGVVANGAREGAIQ